MSSNFQSNILFWEKYWISVLRYESSTLILYYKELSSTIFQNQSVRKASVTPDQISTLCINALYWPSIIKYQLPPPHRVLYWPSTQLHHLVTPVEPTGSSLFSSCLYLYTIFEISPSSMKSSRFLLPLILDLLMWSLRDFFLSWSGFVNMKYLRFLLLLDWF